MRSTGAGVVKEPSCEDPPAMAISDDAGHALLARPLDALPLSPAPVWLHAERGISSVRDEPIPAGMQVEAVEEGGDVVVPGARRMPQS